MSKFPGRIVTDLAPAGYSVFFDGSGDFLTLPTSNSTLWLGSADYSVEAWAYLTTKNAYNNIFSYGTTGSVFRLFVETSQITVWTGATPFITYAYSAPVNTWLNIVVTRASGRVRLFVNGVLVGTALESTNYNTGTLNIGAEAGSLPFTGYIASARIVKGSVPVEYQTSSTTTGTTIFSPPTQLFNITNTSLLTCNSPAIIDQSNNAFAITVNGNAAVSTLTPFPAYVPYNPALGASTPGVWTLDEAMQAAATRQWNMYDPYFNYNTLLLHGNSPTNVPTAVTDASANNFAITAVGDARATSFSPFSLTSFPASGSVYFDGTGDQLTIPSSSAFAVGTVFTFECWIYPLTSGGVNGQPFFVNGTSAEIQIGYQSATSWGIAANGIVWRLTSSTMPTLNAWNHVVAVRSGLSTNQTSLFLNGVRVANGTVADLFITNGTGNIGLFGSGTFTGYISNLRLIKGTAAYDPTQSTITVPTSPLTAVTNTALLTLQNSQSANNNAFLDSSSNNFLITRNGNTTQGTFTPFSQSGWGTHLNGSSYFTVPAGLQTAFAGWGGRTRSWECWIYRDSTTSYNLQSAYAGVVANGRWYISISASNKLVFGWTTSTGTQTEVASATDVPSGWVHLSVSVDSTNSSATTIYLGINGAVQTFVNNNLSTQTSTFGWNGMFDGAQFLPPALNGVFTGLRWSSNVRYTSNYTVPTGPFVNDANTLFLFGQLNRFVDQSSNAYTVAVAAGSPSIRPFSPFYSIAPYDPATIGGSGYFDGSGDALVCSSTGISTALAFGTGDFSLITWIYPLSFAGTQNVADLRAANGPSFGTFYVSTSGALGFYDGSSFETSAGVVRLNSWNHVVWSRLSGTLRMFVNGTQQFSAANTSNYNGGRLTIGAHVDLNQAWVNGYLSGFQILKGTGYSTVTVPTAPPTAIANTSALLNYTNAGILDNTGDNVLETLGGAQISTAQSRFGGSSMLFNGTSGLLKLPPNPLFNFLNGDFTIEFWVYRSGSGSSDSNRLIQFADGDVYTGINIYEASGTVGLLATFSGSSWEISLAIGTISSAWSHIAVVRSGGTIRCYLNGVNTANGSAGTSSIFFSSTQTPVIGGQTGNRYFNGFIDDLRITKGYARYPTAFTPQTSQWQDQ